MTIAQALYEFLGEQSTITALVDDRIFPVELPQPRNEVAPGEEVYDLQDSLVFRMISLAADDGIESLGLRTETWEILALSSQHAQAHEIADAVVAALRGYSGPMPASGGVENADVRLDGGRDEYDSDYQIYAVVLTFSITP